MSLAIARRLSLGWVPWGAAYGTYACAIARNKLPSRPGDRRGRRRAASHTLNLTQIHWRQRERLITYEPAPDAARAAVPQ